jgi:predicted permease
MQIISKTISKIKYSVSGKKILAVSFFVFVFVLLGGLQFASATGWVPEVPLPVSGDGSNGTSDYVSQVYKFVAMIVGILGAMMFMIGGFQYLTSAGNTAAVAQAKKTMFSALAGIIIVLTAYLLLRIINKELVELQEPVTFLLEGEIPLTDFSNSEIGFKVKS